MAKRRATAKDSRLTMDRDAFFVDDAAGTVDRAVCDEISHNKLDNIFGALGGSLDTSTSIINLNIINANTETAQALPANTKKFLIRSRNKGRLRLAYSLGGTTSSYLTIPAGSSFVDDQFYENQTIYIQTTKPGDIIEIVAHV